MYGVQTSYTAAGGGRRSTAPSSLLAVLAALGSPLDGPEDVPDALRARRLEAWRRIVEPVTVAWDGQIADPGLPIRLPAAVAGGPVRVSVALEGEDERDATAEWAGATGPRSVANVEGLEFVESRLRPGRPLPHGYHRLTVVAGKQAASTVVVSAPRRARDQRAPSWGVFLPLYALQSSRSWGVGDLRDLESLLEWLCERGGTLVATLPMLATFLGEGPFEPSPYSPASRMFWNELFLDVDRVPEARDGEAAQMVRSQRLRRELASLRRQQLVDYRRAMAAKRGVLEAMCRRLFSEPGGRRARDLRAWARRHPAVVDYASFRAATERRVESWWNWPAREREGRLAEDGGDRHAYRYHLYVQWLMAEQMEAVSRRARDLGSGLYFDAPIGVSPDGYDVWRERDAFVLGASAGSPPDPFFTQGQDWGFPPLHPERIREQAYRYPIACLRHLLPHAGVLRIDHVMGLHRLFFVPRGFDADRGAYVRYRPEEFYAILALEARRSGTVIVGEDLGTVAAEVRHAMARHHVYRSFVVQYEWRPDPRRAIAVPPEESLATVDTHDMPPFAAFWRGLEVAMRVDRGWMSREAGRQELKERGRIRRAVVKFLAREGHLPPRMAEQDPAGRDVERAVLQALLSYLAAGPARIVLANLEDLWGETRPQNVPGTGAEFPNWCRKARYALEELREHQVVLRALGRMAEPRAR